jgi:hypothetical protein
MTFSKDLSAVKAAFWTQTFTVYSILIGVVVGVAQHSLTKHHYVVAVQIIGSPLLLISGIIIATKIRFGNQRFRDFMVVICGTSRAQTDQNLESTVVTLEMLRHQQFRDAIVSAWRTFGPQSQTGRNLEPTMAAFEMLRQRQFHQLRDFLDAQNHEPLESTVASITLVLWFACLGIGWRPTYLVHFAQPDCFVDSHIMVPEPHILIYFIWKQDANSGGVMLGVLVALYLLSSCAMSISVFRQAGIIK